MSILTKSAVNKLKKIIALAVMTGVTVGVLHAQEINVQQEAFDLNEAILMEAFLRGVAKQCLPKTKQDSFLENSRRHVVFAAQEMGLSERLYEQLEKDIEEKTDHPFFTTMTPQQCEQHQAELILFDASRNATLEALEEILNDVQRVQ